MDTQVGGTYRKIVTEKRFGVRYILRGGAAKVGMSCGATGIALDHGS